MVAPWRNTLAKSKQIAAYSLPILLITNVWKIYQSKSWLMFQFKQASLQVTWNGRHVTTSQAWLYSLNSCLKLSLYGSYVTARGTVFKIKYSELHLTLYGRYIRAGRNGYKCLNKNGLQGRFVTVSQELYHSCKKAPYS